MECCTIFPSFLHSVPSSAQHLYIMIKRHSKSHNIIRQISFFSFWLKPADSSFSCWHFLVSLCYAYTMTKVIITNYLNTYHLYAKKKDVCVILIQTRKDILLLVVLTTDWLVFSFNFLINKRTFFCHFFTWNWCIFFCSAKFLF